MNKAAYILDHSFGHFTIDYLLAIVDVGELQLAAGYNGRHYSARWSEWVSISS